LEHYEPSGGAHLDASMQTHWRHPLSGSALEPRHKSAFGPAVIRTLAAPVLATLGDFPSLLDDFSREETVSHIPKQHDIIKTDIQPKGLLTLQSLLTHNQQSSSQEAKNTPLSSHRSRPHQQMLWRSLAVLHYLSPSSSRPIFFEHPCGRSPRAVSSLCGRPRPTRGNISL
jgi:hypothetical protein